MAEPSDPPKSPVVHEFESMFSGGDWVIAVVGRQIKEFNVTDALQLTSLLEMQPKPDCAALTPFAVEDADLQSGRVVLRFAPQPAFKNHFGNVQGGFAVAMIDVLVSIAAYAKTRQWLPTIEIKTSFVAPLKLSESRGEASVIKAGKQLVFLEAKLWGADGRLSVHATATASIPAA